MCSIGYFEQSKANKLYKPNIKKLIINKDMIFLKDEAWNDQQVAKKCVGVEIAPMEL